MQSSSLDCSNFVGVIKANFGSSNLLQTLAECSVKSVIGELSTDNDYCIAVKRHHFEYQFKFSHTHTLKQEQAVIQRNYMYILMPLK